MTEETGILLNSHYVNKMKINGELAWYTEEMNASTGYNWQVIVDYSGVYEHVETIFLHASVNAAGVPGRIIWKFKAVREGKGNVLFELFPPGSEKPVKTTAVYIEVSK